MKNNDPFINSYLKIIFEDENSYQVFSSSIVKDSSTQNFDFLEKIKKAGENLSNDTINKLKARLKQFDDDNDGQKRFDTYLNNDLKNLLLNIDELLHYDRSSLN